MILRSVRHQHIAKAMFCAAVAVVGLSGEELNKEAEEASDLEALGQIQVESIYSASKYEQKVTRAATSASIITRDEIQRFGYRNLADVLRGVRGFNVSNDRNYSYIGLRGFLRPGDYTTRVLVLVNGHRMNENIYDSGTLGPDGYIDIDLVDRVEVVRGPGSSIYGNNAFFGVINIVTRTGAQIDGVEVSAEAGNFDTYKGRFTYGKKFENEVQFTLSGSVLTSEGEDHVYIPEFGGTADDSDEERIQNLFGSISWKGFTLEGNYYWRYKNIPTASFGTIFNSRNEWTKDGRSYVEFRYETPVESEVGVMAKVSYDEYDYDAIYPFDYGLGVPVLNYDQSLGRWISPEVTVRREFFDRVSAMIGADARLSLDQRMVNYDDNPRFVYLDSTALKNIYGVYIQTDLELLENLSFVTGLRYDYVDRVGGEINPRAGLIYNPFKNTTLKALYGEAFRAPNSYELAYNQPELGGLGNLQAEKIRTYELVAEQYFLKNYRASLSLYRFEVDNLISQVDTAMPSPSGYTFSNEPGVVGNGVETEFEARFDSGLLARASYAFQKTEDFRGSELSNSPRHLVKAGLVVPIYKEKLFSGIEFQYTSSALTLGGNHADDFVIVNWTLYGRELLPGLDLSLSVYNLFDQRYGYPGGEDVPEDVVPQEGRAFRAKLTYRF